MLVQDLKELQQVRAHPRLHIWPHITHELLTRKKESIGFAKELRNRCLIVRRVVGSTRSGTVQAKEIPESGERLRVSIVCLVASYGKDFRCCYAIS